MTTELYRCQACGDSQVDETIPRQLCWRSWRTGAYNRQRDWKRTLFTCHKCQGKSDKEVVQLYMELEKAKYSEPIL